MFLAIFPMFVLIASLKKWTGIAEFLNASSGEEPEALLIKKARQGDRLAFQTLLEQHYDTIFQVAYRCTGHTEDAEDITQDVCISLAHKIDSYRGEAKFQTWLYRIVINACLDKHRKEEREQNYALRYLAFEDHARTNSKDRQQHLAWLYRELAKLKAPFKETAFLVLAEDLSHADVGEVLGCSEATISWRMHEIRHQLKAIAESYYDA